jgi:hypothetical protein
LHLSPKIELLEVSGEPIFAAIVVKEKFELEIFTNFPSHFSVRFVAELLQKYFFNLAHKVLFYKPFCYINLIRTF